MSTVLPDAPPTAWTMADVQARLPGFPPDRIRTYPAPGTATEEDVLEAEARSNRICELIDGTLVEKTMATSESMLAAALIYLISRYLDVGKLGVVLAPDGLLRILPGQVRAPDVSFIRWERLPDRGSPKPPIYALAPDLAIEILSKGTRHAKWIASCASILRPVFSWSGTSSQKTTPLGLTHPSRNGPRSIPMARSSAAKFSPASNCPLPNYSPESKGQMRRE